MAPRHSRDRPSHARYSGMVQPALPLPPSTRLKKTTAGAVVPIDLRNGSATNSAAPSIGDDDRNGTDKDSVNGEGPPQLQEEPSSPNPPPIPPQDSSPRFPDLVDEVRGEASNDTPDLPTTDQNATTKDTKVSENSTGSVSSDASQNEVATTPPAVPDADDKEPRSQSPDALHSVISPKLSEGGPSSPVLGLKAERPEVGLPNGTTFLAHAPHRVSRSQSEQSLPEAGFSPTSAPTASESAPGSDRGMPEIPADPAASDPPPPVLRPFSPQLLSLQDHLLRLTMSKEYADWAIQVNPRNGSTFVTYAHSVIIFRSPQLQRLMSRAQTSSYGSNLIPVYPPRPVLPHAFEAALRFLYSDTVLTEDFFTKPGPGRDAHATRMYNLDYIMSYWMAGIELGLEPVTSCAHHLLTGALDWDTVENAYKYANELAAATASARSGQPTAFGYALASTLVLKMILEFLAPGMDVDHFKLDLGSTSAVLAPRLPQVDEDRPRSANPALAAMVFGSMPSSADISPASPESELGPASSTLREAVATAILVNVDYEHLTLFNELLHQQWGSRATPLVAALVQEREARRVRVCNCKSIPNKTRLSNPGAWEVVGVKEVLTGTTLSRERVGYLLPTK